MKMGTINQLFARDKTRHVYNNTIKHFHEYLILTDNEKNKLQFEYNNRKYYFDFKLVKGLNEEIGLLKFAFSNTFNNVEIFKQYAKYCIDNHKQKFYIIKTSEDVEIKFPHWQIAMNKNQKDISDLTVVIISFDKCGRPTIGEFYYKEQEYSPETYYIDTKI